MCTVPSIPVTPDSSAPLRDAIDALEAQCRQLRMAAELNQMTVVAQQRTISQLRLALRKYGWHTPGCGSLRLALPKVLECNCGYEATKELTK